MSESGSKAQRRHLRQQVGAAAADVVTSMKDTVTRIELAHQVLARQMLDFETTASRLVESRAVDRKAFEGMREQVESAHAKIGAERSHALRLAEEQRRYVDGADADVKRQLRTDRQLATGSLHNRIVVFESLTFWQRLRWLATGGLPTAGERERQAADQRLADAQPHVVARDAYEAAWTDLGRPDAGDAHLGAVGGE